MKNILNPVYTSAFHDLYLHSCGYSLCRQCCMCTVFKNKGRLIACVGKKLMMDEYESHTIHPNL